MVIDAGDRRGGRRHPDRRTGRAAHRLRRDRRGSTVARRRHLRADPVRLQGGHLPAGRTRRSRRGWGSARSAARPCSRRCVMGRSNRSGSATPDARDARRPLPAERHHRPGPVLGPDVRRLRAERSVAAGRRRHRRGRRSSTRSTGRPRGCCGSTSRIGAELDSLSDCISFGVAPALLMYVWLLREEARGFGWVVCLLFAVCAALRLARFNSLLDDTPKPWAKGFFTGVPTPAGGLLSTAPLLLTVRLGDDGLWANPWVVSLWVVFIGLHDGVADPDDRAQVRAGAAAAHRAGVGAARAGRRGAVLRAGTGRRSPACSSTSLHMPVRGVEVQPPEEPPRAVAPGRAASGGAGRPAGSGCGCRGATGSPAGCPTGRQLRPPGASRRSGTGGAAGCPDGACHEPDRQRRLISKLPGFAAVRRRTCSASDPVRH